MPIVARYVHTNLIAQDWRRLARFYEDVFGCKPVPPEREFSGTELEKGTGIPGSRLRGVHLRLPGVGNHGPTLEIFEYEPAPAATSKAVNRQGYGHIAFAVEDVEAARRQVLEAGGSALGEISQLETSDGQTVTWCYLADPEGNAVELQHWN